MPPRQTFFSYVNTAIIQGAAEAGRYLQENDLLTLRFASRRQKVPLLITASVGVGALFVGMKWKAVLARSDAAKKASTKENYNYSVAPGRSGNVP